MIRFFTALIMLFIAAAGSASHTVGGMDLCVVYKEIMPPGLAPEAMPDAGSPGAILVSRYCTQCHMQPGPGHHTAQEWPVVLSYMTDLMQDTARFGGLMGGVKAPTDAEVRVLRAYLERHALRPWPNGDPPPVMVDACGDCHAVPDPSQHTPSEWPAVLQRMQLNRSIMGRARLDVTSEAAVLAVLVRQNSSEHPGSSTMAPNHAGSVPRGSADRGGLGSRNAWLALGPFLVFVTLGVWRWHRRSAAGTREGGSV